jgi:hypothetical protein
MRKTPVVLGVLSIIFGSVGAVMSLLTLFIGPALSKLSQFAKNLPQQGELQRAQLEASDAMFSELAGYMKLTSFTLLVMSAVLVVIGVGLYRRRAWSRPATVTWSLVGVALVVANFFYSTLYQQPHQRAIHDAIYAAHGVTAPFEIGAAGQMGIVLFSSLMYCAFPAVLLALIGRRSALRDFLPAA